MGQVCCKSKKGLPVEEQPEDSQEVVKLPDYIKTHQLEEGFAQYCATNFDLENKEKYLLDDKLGLFSFDCIVKVFMAAFVWKNIIADRANKPFLKERRELLKLGDSPNYRRVIQDMEDLEEKVFQSAFIRVKEKLEILESNFQKSMSVHLVDKKNQEKL